MSQIAPALFHDAASDIVDSMVPPLSFQLNNVADDAYLDTKLKVMRQWLTGHLDGMPTPSLFPAARSTLWYLQRAIRMEDYSAAAIYRDRAQEDARKTALMCPHAPKEILWLAHTLTNGGAHSPDVEVNPTYIRLQNSDGGFEGRYSTKKNTLSFRTSESHYWTLLGLIHSLPYRLMFSRMRTRLEVQKRRLPKHPLFGDRSIPFSTLPE